MRMTLRTCAALVCLMGGSVIRSETYQGSASLSTQAQIDGFAYDEVTGSLTVSGNDITDLSPLSSITEIGGYLLIDNCPALITVDGFGSLTHVGSGFYVSDNDNLVTFSGFNQLVRTGDNLEFSRNASLVSIDAFASLHTVDYTLEFYDNPSLVSLPEFPSLRTIVSSLFITYNNSLERITGFNQLQHVGWSFQISNNSSLNKLCGFFNYFSANNPYTGGGTFGISDNHPSLPSPTTMEYVINECLAALSAAGTVLSVR